VGNGFTTDGVSQLTLGVIGASVGGLLLTNLTSGTIELRPATGALGTTVLTLFAGSDTLVGLAATQTLTNKTLTNPQINGAVLETTSTVGYVWTATNTTGAGSWQAPSGTTTNSLTINNSGTGSASAITFNGSTAITISSNTILPSFTGNNGLYLRLNSSTALPEWASATGSGTVNSGTQYQLAYYATNGTAVSGLTLLTATRALVSDANGLPVASTVSTTQLQYLSSATGTTGTTSTNLVFSTSPTLTTPDIGAATATSINKVAITAPATSATLTIENGKTLTASNTLTFTGTDSSSVAFGAGGTVAYVGLANSWTSGIKQTFAPSATTAGVNVGSVSGDVSSPANGDLWYDSTGNLLRARINGATVSLGAGGGVTSFQTSLSGLTPSTATTGVVTLAGTLNVASGGTGVTTNTAYAVLCGGTTSTGAVQSVASVGTAGQVLTSNGAGALPTFQTGGGTVALNSVLASTAAATISHGNFVNTWNWNSNTTSNAFVLGSTRLTSGSLFTLTHTTSALTGNLASFTSTGITSGNLLNIVISGSTDV